MGCNQSTNASIKSSKKIVPLRSNSSASSGKYNYEVLTPRALTSRSSKSAKIRTRTQSTLEEFHHHVKRPSMDFTKNQLMATNTEDTLGNLGSGSAGGRTPLGNVRKYPLFLISGDDDSSEGGDNNNNNRSSKASSVFYISPEDYQNMSES